MAEPQSFPTFTTIISADWRRELRRARAERNEVAAQIRQHEAELVARRTTPPSSPSLAAERPQDGTERQHEATAERQAPTTNPPASR